MAKSLAWSQGDGRLYLSIAAGTFLLGLLVSSFLFPPAHAEDLLIDLKASMPAPLPQPELTVDTPAAPVVQPSDDQRLISLLSADSASEKPQTQKEQWQTVRMKVTGYCPCSKCCGTEDGITACNHHIQKGDAFAAADKRYSFGTEMIIPGYNSDRPVKVMDRGGAIKGNHLDLFFHTHQEALRWGVQYLDVQTKTN